MRLRRGDPSRKRQGSSKIVLESGYIQEIAATKKRMAEIGRYHYDYFNELAWQRKAAEPDLVRALAASASRGFSIDHFQRLVKAPYLLHPLCTLGSLQGVGGRFNCGDFEPDRFPKFSALYMAEDKDTAFQEGLGQDASGDTGLSMLEMALAYKESIAIFSISGQVDSCFSLLEPKSLEPFVKVVRNFRIPGRLKNWAKKLGLPEPRVVKTTAELLGALLEKEWRLYPMQLDVPSNSQIFGQLLRKAGVEAILYPSKMNNKRCLAVFTGNFQGAANSWLALDEPLPPHICVKRIDWANGLDCERTGDEIVSRCRSSITEQ